MESRDKYRVYKYKGYPVLALNMGYNEFSFGVKKARAILDNIEAIKKFVEDHANKE